MSNIDVSNVIVYEELDEEVAPGVWEKVRRVAAVGPAVAGRRPGDEDWRISIPPPEISLGQQVKSLQDVLIQKNVLTQGDLDAEVVKAKASPLKIAAFTAAIAAPAGAVVARLLGAG